MRDISSLDGRSSATPQPRSQTASAVNSPTPGSARSVVSASSRPWARSRSVSSTPSRAARAIPCSQRDLLFVKASGRRQLEQPSRPRKRNESLAVDRGLVAQLLAQPLLDHGALAHRDALTDHERRRGLVRGVEAHRAHEVVRLLETSDHLVALADRRPIGAIVVERQRASRLAADLVDQRRRGIGSTDHDAVIPLADFDRGG